MTWYLTQRFLSFLSRKRRAMTLASRHFVVKKPPAMQVALIEKAGDIGGFVEDNTLTWPLSS